MRLLRESSFEEYAAWYLAREAANKLRSVLNDRAQDSIALMRQEHQGKLRDWFNGRARWSVVELDRPELERLVFLESDWTKEEKLVLRGGSPNYRLLDRVARNAEASRYLESPRASRHRKYHEDLKSGQLHLVGESRIAICSVEDSERHANPSADWYLLDGVGRCLPLMMLLHAGTLKFEPVEAFLAKRLSPAA